MFRVVACSWLIGLLTAMYALPVQAQSADRINYLLEAASHGSNEALYELGTIYKSGNGVTRSYTRANQYYEQAARAGYAPAQNNFGWSYRQGLGVEKDSQQAIYWFRKSALQGNALALQNLGEMYQSGEGVVPDANQVTLLFRLCAVQVLNQEKSEGGFDNAVLECRRDIGRSELNQARTIEDYRRATFYLLFAMQPGQDYRRGHGAGYDRAVKIMREAKSLYDVAYAKLDAQSAAWVQGLVANSEAVLSEVRRRSEQPAVLRQ